MDDSTRERTRRALELRRLEGLPIGRPRVIPAAVEREILRLHAEGYGPRAIVRRLETEGIAAPSGGAWHPSTILRVTRRSG